MRAALLLVLSLAAPCWAGDQPIRTFQHDHYVTYGGEKAVLPGDVWASMRSIEPGRFTNAQRDCIDGASRWEIKHVAGRPGVTQEALLEGMTEMEQGIRTQHYDAVNDAGRVIDFSFRAGAHSPVPDPITRTAIIQYWPRTARSPAPEAVGQGPGEVAVFRMFPELAQACAPAPTGSNEFARLNHLFEAILGAIPTVGTAKHLFGLREVDARAFHANLLHAATEIHASDQTVTIRTWQQDRGQNIRTEFWMSGGVTLALAISESNDGWNVYAFRDPTAATPPAAAASQP